MLAPSTLNMFPKFELAPILMYLTMLPKILRPSSTPSESTIRLFSRRMMSADSLAISTAVSTEIPTSALFSAGPSLMPSPRKPTTCPARCRASMIRDFCAGDTLAQTVTVSRRRASSWSVSWSISPPRRTSSVGTPTSRQILRAIMSLSPVRILTRTPELGQRRDRSPGTLLWRIEEGDIAE